MALNPIISKTFGHNRTIPKIRDSEKFIDKYLIDNHIRNSKSENMAEHAASKKRSASASALNESIRELERYKEKENISKRLLEQKLNSVIAAKQDLIIKHHNYAEKSNNELDSEELLEYLRPKLDQCTDIIDEVTVMIEDLENRIKEEKIMKESTACSNAQERKHAYELVVAEMQATVDEEILIDSMQRITEITGDAKKANIEGRLLVEALLDEIECLLEKQIKSWNHMKSLTIQDEKLKSIFKRENEIKKLFSHRRSIGIAFVKKISSIEATKIVVKKECDKTAKDVTVRLEKMKVPTFHGNIRAFARFKADFKAIVEPSYLNKTHQTYVLKENCLHGEAKQLVENIDDIEAIWSRLQEKYGDNIEIVNVIIKDIEKVTFPKNNQDYGLVTLVDTLEKGIQDLTAIDARKEIANAYTVKLLEMKLPKRVFAK